MEALAVLALAGVLVGAVGAASRGLERHAALASARGVAASFRLARSEAVATARALGACFDEGEGGWTLGLAVDGDGDGIRRDDLARGRDAWREPPRSFESAHQGARPGFLPGLRSLSSPPPGSRRLGDLRDPVRFGSGDTVTFTPRGQATPGTLYLTDGKWRQLAVVVYGATGRVRTWEWDATSGAWRPR